MPYIKQTNRDHLDIHIDRLATALLDLNPNERSGNLNYSITRLLIELFPENKYHEISLAASVLESAKQEWYRRRMGPREDQAAFENGDVYPSGVDLPND